MMTSPIFWAAACAVMTAGLLAAEARESATLRWVFKPAASACFIALAISAGAMDSRFGNAILLGLVFCAAGDVLLIPAQRAAFLAGMAAFALGHIAYAGAFVAGGVKIGLAAMAALAFGMDQRLETRVLIFDLGGGTFDATVLELTDNIFDVMATRGDGFLGGIDFDRAVQNKLVEHCRSRHGVDPAQDKVVMQRLLSAAENAKVALTGAERHTVHVPMLGHDRRGRPFDLEMTIDREELEQLTAHLVERTLGIVEEMFSTAALTPRDIEHVIMVGGMSRMPLVRRRLQELMGKPPLTHLDPETAIAHGAALVARGEGDLAGMVLLDVLSVPVGLVFPGGRTEFVFETNTRLPARRRVNLPDPQEGRDMVVGVWQGPDITSSERQVLGVVRVPTPLMGSASPRVLEFHMGEGMELNVAFVSPTHRVPLTVEPPARG